MLDHTPHPHPPNTGTSTQYPQSATAVQPTSPYNNEDREDSGIAHHNSSKQKRTPDSNPTNANPQDTHESNPLESEESHQEIQ